MRLRLAATASRAWDAVTTTAPRAAPTRLAGLDARHVGHIEVDRLGRYLAVAALVCASLLINAWSRIDLRQTSVDLATANRSFKTARAENARLRLELATLRDPARLQEVATTLDLDATAVVVDVPSP